MPKTGREVLQLNSHLQHCRLDNNSVERILGICNHCRSEINDVRTEVASFEEANMIWPLQPIQHALLASAVTIHFQNMVLDVVGEATYGEDMIW